MNGNDDNDKWLMKSDLCIDSHCSSLSELGTHLSTVELVLLCSPFSCLHKHLDWTDIAGAGRGVREKKQIGKKEAVTLDEMSNRCRAAVSSIIASDGYMY